MKDEYVLQSTFCNYNYGSSLQCYAVQKFFAKYGAKCVLIQEKNTMFERVIFSLKRRATLYFMKRKYPEIDTISQKQQDAVNCAKKAVRQNSLADMNRFIAKEINSAKLSYIQLYRLSRKSYCKMCIAGSDQIWNCENIYTNPVYFLSFAPRHKRVSFAPSFGGGKLSRYNRSQYCHYIQRFNKLSVREESGQRIVAELTNRTAELLMDPVFLMNAHFWTEFSRRSSIQQLVPEKYIFAFFLNEPNKEAVQQMNRAKKEGIHIISIGYFHPLFQSEVSPILIDGGPREFVDLIRRADCIMTDSFHATAFSAIFHKRALVFHRQYLAGNQSERLIDFIRQMELPYSFGTELPSVSANDFDVFEKKVNENQIKVIKYFEFEKNEE